MITLRPPLNGLFCAVYVVNAITKLGYAVKLVEKPEDISNASALIFPGVGAFGSAMEVLHKAWCG